MSNSNMTAGDVVAAGISVGVRVERVVVLPGGDNAGPLVRAIIAAGGKREGDSEVFAGLDSDGVEWRLAVASGRGVSVVCPTTPGNTPVEQARFAKMEDAREYVSIVRSRRRDLRNAGDIRIDTGKSLLIA